jgi:hypothetical protein
MVTANVTDDSNILLASAFLHSSNYYQGPQSYFEKGIPIKIGSELMI